MFASSIFAGLPIAGSVPVDVKEYMGPGTITLVEDRANEISFPFVKDAGIQTRLMSWDDATNRWIAAGSATRISEVVKQINKRCTGSSVLTNAVVARCEAIDADTGNRWVFTPGATPVGSLQDFELIIPDQGGGYEGRGFQVYLQPNGNPTTIDGGEVLLRLLPSALPW
jgi:hypothetical protein